jgi:DNA-binding MarR family transcriptional regulator
MDRAELAAEIWRRLFDFIIETAAERNRVLGRHDLTPNDSRTLFALDARLGRSMGSLAEEWGCDASYATSVVDRLERKGLVARSSSRDDRRVKLALLTPVGARLRETLARELYRPPAALAALPTADLRALAAAVDRLPR